MLLETRKGPASVITRWPRLRRAYTLCLAIPAPSLCAPEPPVSVDVVALIHAPDCPYGKLWFWLVMLPPGPPDWFDGSVRWDRCHRHATILASSRRAAEQLSLGNYRPRWPRMIAGSPLTAATSADALRMSLSVVFLNAFMFRVSPCLWVSDDRGCCALRCRRPRVASSVFLSTD